MDSPPKRESLAFVISFLRSEGLYAAEEALNRELESRFPKGLAHDSPTASGSGQPGSPQFGDAAPGSNVFEFVPPGERGHADPLLRASTGR